LFATSSLKGDAYAVRGVFTVLSFKFDRFGVYIVFLNLILQKTIKMCLSVYP